MKGNDLIMNIVYPIYFTLGGVGVRWREVRNRIRVDINYTNNNNIINTDILNTNHLNGSFEIINGPVSGYFIENNEMVRVTNLIGYDGYSILKLCPNCGNVKTLEEFDYEGRDSGGRRDQSNCMECRKSY